MENTADGDLTKKDIPPNIPGTQTPISRRQLLTHFLKSHNLTTPKESPPSQRPSNETQDPVHSTENELDKLTLSRRQLLQIMAATGATLAAEKYLHISPAEAAQNVPSAPVPEQEPPLPQSAPVPDVQTQAKEDPTLLDTAIETTLFNAAQMLSAPLVKILGIPVGNAAISPENPKEMMEKPLKNLFLVGGVAPALEETIFRLFPQVLISEKTKGNI